MLTRRLVLLIIFVLAFISGTVGIAACPPGVLKQPSAAITGDGVTISYTLYVPPGGEPGTVPLVVIGHGFLVNKEMLDGYAVDIASQGIAVAALDWRGHGLSTGTLEDNKLATDLDAVIDDAISALGTLVNTSALGLMGYSMGGFPTFSRAASDTAVKAWVGIGTSTYAERLNLTGDATPDNVFLINGVWDEAFDENAIREDLALLVPDVASGAEIESGEVYGDVSAGTARKLEIVPVANHLTLAWDPRFIGAVTAWFTESLLGRPAILPGATWGPRVAFLGIGFIGLLGIISMLTIWLGSKHSRAKNKKDGDGEEKKQLDAKEDPFSTAVGAMSTPKFIAGYHVVTLALFPTVVLPGLLVLLPMAMGGFLTAMVASLAINMLIFLLLAFRKKVRAKEILRRVYVHERREWGPAAVLAAIYAAGYYLLVGRHWLATIPSVSRLPYLPLFGVVVFASICVYSFMIQEVLFPLVDAKMSQSGEKARSAVKIVLGAEMPFSFFFILLLVPSVIIGNYFLMLPVYLMIPIFTVSSLLGLLFKKHGWSTLPATLMIVVVISLVVTTLSPLGFLSAPAIG